MRRIALVVAVVAALVLVPLAVFALVSPGSGHESFTASPTVPADWSPAHPGETPPGGISRDEAIRLARIAAHAETRYRDATATVTYFGNRWEWEVELEDYGGPTGSQGAQVRLDFFTGRVLDVREWVS